MSEASSSGNAKRPWWKRALLAVLAVVVLLGAAVAGVVAYARADLASRGSRTYDIRLPPLTVRYDAATVARGEHLAKHVAGCTECHGDDLGGKVFVDDPGLGRISAPNLTRGEGGRGARLGEADWLRAIRYGVGDAHRPLFIMPVRDYQTYSGEDIAAMIAYARTVPPVDRIVPSRETTPLAAVLALAGKLPSYEVEAIDVNAPLPAAVPVGRTVEYGRYLAQTCTGCHRADWSGGPMAAAPPDAPPVSNLTPGGELAQWSEADFVRAMREGKRPDGRSLHPFMPWRAFAGMTDDELGALFVFLRQLSAKPQGT
jgi:cytochrome c553